MKNKLLVVIGVIVVSLGWYVSTTSEDPSDKSISTDIKNQVQEVTVRFPIPIVESGQTTFYVADELGFYKNEGIKTRFEMGSRELNPVKMVVTKQDTFGVLGGPDTLLVARSKGHPLKAIAVVHRNSNFTSLITLKSSGITNLKQLNEKQIGFFYGHISTDVIRSLLRENNISATEVDVGFDYSQLVSGRIDAEWAFTVTAGIDLPAKGIEINTISPSDYGIITHGYTIFAHEDTINENPEMIQAFLKATLKGIEYTVEHPEEANDIFHNRAPTTDKELTLKRQLAYNAVTSNSVEFPPGYMDRDMFESTYKRLLDENVIANKIDINEAFTLDFLEKINN